MLKKKQKTSSIFASHSSIMLLGLRAIFNRVFFYIVLFFPLHSLKRVRKKLWTFLKVFCTLQPHFISLSFLWFSLNLLGNKVQKVTSIRAPGIFYGVQISWSQTRAWFPLSCSKNHPLLPSRMQFSHFVEAKDPWESSSVSHFAALWWMTQKTYQKQARIHQNHISAGTMLLACYASWKKKSVSTLSTWWC